MKYNDDKLIYYIHLHNKTAYQILYEKYLRITKSILAKNLDFNSIDVYEFNDMLQECMVLLNKTIYLYRNEEGTFFMYYRSVIYNVLYTHLKTLNNLKTRVIFECQEEDNENNIFLRLKDSINLSENFNYQEDRKYLISQCKNELENRVLYLKQEGYTYKEISALLGISVKRVDYLLANVKKRCKNIL